MELLVVIVIIGILATIALRSFSGAQAKARDARRKRDVDSITKALEAYYNDKGQYPTGDSNGLIEGCAGATGCSWGEALQDSNGTYYMVQLPEDPLYGWRYFYVSSDGSDYQLYAKLENEDDQVILKDTNDNTLFYNATFCTNAAQLCNYGTASSNSQLSTDLVN